MESMWESVGVVGVVYKKSRENEIVFGALKQTTQLTIRIAIRSNPTYTKMCLYLGIKTAVRIFSEDK